MRKYEGLCTELANVCGDGFWFGDLDIQEENKDKKYIISAKLGFSQSYENVTIDDSYDLRIELPYDYSRTLPVVFNVDGKIPNDPDNHNNEKTGLCLATTAEIKERLSQTAGTFIDFVRELIIPFLYAHSYKQQYHKYPWGPREHFGEGILSEYKDFFELRDLNHARDFMKELSKYKRSIKGHNICMCGSGKKFRDCHQKKYLERLAYYSHREMRLDYCKAMKN